LILVPVRFPLAPDPPIALRRGSALQLPGFWVLVLQNIHLGVTSAVNFCLTKRFAIHLQGRNPLRLFSCTTLEITTERGTNLWYFNIDLQVKRLRSVLWSGWFIRAFCGRSGDLDEVGVCFHIIWGILLAIIETIVLKSG